MTWLCFLSCCFRNTPTLIPAISCRSVNISSDVSSNGLRLSSKLSFLHCPLPVRFGCDNCENNSQTHRKDVLADLAFLADPWWTIRWSITTPIHLALIPTKNPGRMSQFTGRNFNEKSSGFLSIIYTTGLI